MATIQIGARNSETTPACALHGRCEPGRARCPHPEAPAAPGDLVLRNDGKLNPGTA